MRNLFQYIALRHLKTKLGRTVLGILGIACGIALYVAITIINESTSGYFKESMTAVSGKATLQISAGEVGFSEKVSEKVEQVEGVKDSVPIIENRSWLVATNESVMVLGVDLLQEKAVRSYKDTGKKIMGDAMVFMSQPDSMILTDTFAKAHNIKMDDKLELSTSKGTGRFTIRGLLAPTGLATAYGGGMAIMDIDAARIAFGKEGKTDRIDVVTQKGADVDVVAQRLRATLGPSFTVQRPEMASQQMERMVESFQFMSHFFSTLALIVGIFLIANTVSISVAERRKEIGTLRALGTTRAGILTMFVSEAFAMGTLGSLLGAGAGRVVASLMVDAVTKAMTEQTRQNIASTDLKFTAANLASAVALGAVASVIAAFIPSLKATRVDPIEAMKRKDTGEAAHRKGWQRYSGLIGLGLMALSAAGSMLVTESKLIQVFSQLVSIIGAALLGPAVILFVMRLIQPFAVKREKMVPRLAIDNILRNPKRTATNVTNLMVGLTLVVIIACVNVSFKGTLLRFFDRILHADLIISTTGRMQSHETQALSETLLTEIQKNPAVLGAYGLREINVMYQNDGQLLKYYGEPPAPEQAGEPRYNIFDTVDRESEAMGHDLFHSSEPTILVSQNFVVHYKKKTGDSMELMTPSGAKQFRIVGVINDYANPNGTLVVARSTYRSFFNDPLVSGIAVKLKKGADPVEVRKQLDIALSKKHKLTIMLNSDIKTQVGQIIDQSFAYTRSIEIAALLVALFGLMNTLLISVLERTRELGLSRAVGMTRKQVSKMILLEAAGQGGLGALISMFVGTFLGLLWVTQNLAHSLGWVVDFFVPWEALAKVLCLGLLVTMASIARPRARS
ncbi:MAG: FtsX-like permease family protein [Deltaproteobacteria bacterium]|nr:FtsX-like permease family protein [Deltaproteobacteria bacterium]